MKQSILALVLLASSSFALELYPQGNGDIKFLNQNTQSTQEPKASGVNLYPSGTDAVGDIKHIEPKQAAKPKTQSKPQEVKVKPKEASQTTKADEKPKKQEAPKIDASKFMINN